MATKKAVGRPPKYKSKEEIEEKIDAYFKQCEGEVLKVARLAGLSSCTIFSTRTKRQVGAFGRWLGFSTRLSLLNYQGKKEFMNTITRAKARVEAYAEERLFDRDGSSGAQFSLRNNFKGWTEKTELDEEEQQARIEQIRANTARMSGGDGDEDGGVEIVNDAPKEASEDIGDNNPEIPADI